MLHLGKGYFFLYNIFLTGHATLADIFFFKQKTAYEIGLGIPAEPLFRSLICILTKNVITSCSVTMMLFLHLEVKPLMTLTTVLYLSCALISGHLAMMLMELTKRR